MRREWQRWLFPPGAIRAKRVGGGAVEFRLHCAIADLVRRLCQPGWRWTHLPFGEYRPPATAARLKRMGTSAGWPDLLFVHGDGRVVWIELKRRGARPSRAQEELADHLEAAGHGFYVADSFDAAVAALKREGIVRVV